MTLSQIAVFVVLGLLYLAVVPARWRGWALYLVSLIAIYALQPTLNVRWLDYSLPTATILLAAAGWWLTRPAPESDTLTQRFSRDDALAFVVLVIVALALTISRYIDLPFELTSRPPEVTGVILAIIATVGFTVVFGALPIRPRLTLAIIALIGLFIVIKSPSLATTASAFLRERAAQDASLASPIDLGWLGFSYVAFRLIHTLRDRQMGILPAVGLREYITFIIFFPAYTAGPIDRLERFHDDYAALLNLRGLDPARVLDAGQRITIGLFKKFVIADSLALFSLNETLAMQAQNPGALWLSLYAYAFRLLFDFSGYTDIAIGIGLLFGIRLPENFNRPYFKSNITLFWQSWHMTLSNWARFYVYSPVSRSLLRRKPKPPNLLIIFICNLLTMGVIGLWHGITLPFAIWGLWHGVGLSVHKYWSDQTRTWYRNLQADPARRRAWSIVGVLLTFHFVLLGWVWFALPDFATASSVFLRLFGLG
jgi:alginate O-acetyltransferase complex protein AlgI